MTDRERELTEKLKEVTRERDYWQSEATTYRLMLQVRGLQKAGLSDSQIKKLMRKERDGETA